MRARVIVVALIFAGCHSESVSNVTPSSSDGAMPANVDMSVPENGPDASASHHDDLGPGNTMHDGAMSAGEGPDGGMFTNPGANDNPVVHAAPTAIATSTLLTGKDVLDVSVDQGGGIWAVTTSTVYYFPPGKATPFTYDQKNGLARGWYTWTDTWFNPGTWPVTFQSVAGGMPGEAIVGNIGAIADRLEVNPSTGAIIRLDNMQVTPQNTNASEYPEHVKRVVAAWRAVVDLNGTFQGTSYIGGFHGFYAFHGMTADCGCLAFEEHQHYITDTIVGGDDVRALAISPSGDVWQGDRDFVTLLPQRSKGPNTGFFDYDFTVGLDVFPNVRDEVWGLAVDSQDGVWVASYGNGLAYLSPATHAATFWSSASTLPQNHLTSVALDGKGNLWVGTDSAGIARLNPANGQWIYYTQSSGLPSNDIRTVYWDKYASTGKMYIATDYGIAITTP